jgi:hypothetical protein
MAKPKKKYKPGPATRCLSRTKGKKEQILAFPAERYMKAHKLNVSRARTMHLGHAYQNLESRRGAFFVKAKKIIVDELVCRTGAPRTMVVKALTGKLRY